MSRPKQSAEKFSEMQNRILDATISVLEESGPEEISIRKIADKLEISHMVIYTYFKDRGELISSLIQRMEGRVNARFEDLISQMDRNEIRDKLQDALRDYIQTVKARPRIFRLLWLTPAAQTKKNHPFFQKTIKMLTNLLDQGMQKQVFVKRDPTIASLTVMSIIHAPLILYHCGRLTEESTRDRVVDESLQVAIQYLTGNLHQNA